MSLLTSREEDILRKERIVLKDTFCRSKIRAFRSIRESEDLPLEVQEALKQLFLDRHQYAVTGFMRSCCMRDDDFIEAKLRADLMVIDTLLETNPELSEYLSYDKSIYTNLGQIKLYGKGIDETSTAEDILYAIEKSAVCADNINAELESIFERVDARFHTSLSTAENTRQKELEFNDTHLKVLIDVDESNSRTCSEQFRTNLTCSNRMLFDTDYIISVTMRMQSSRIEKEIKDSLAILAADRHNFHAFLNVYYMVNPEKYKYAMDTIMDNLDKLDRYSDKYPELDTKKLKEKLEEIDSSMKAISNNMYSNSFIGFISERNKMIEFYVLCSSFDDKLAKYLSDVGHERNLPIVPKFKSRSNIEAGLKKFISNAHRVYCEEYDLSRQNFAIETREESVQEAPVVKHKKEKNKKSWKQRQEERRDRKAEMMTMRNFQARACFDDFEL